MAVHAPIMRAPGGATTFYPLRAPRVRRLLSALSPCEIGYAIEALIARLDYLDGDLDCELTGAEDDCMGHAGTGPGCLVSDQDHCIAYDDNLGFLIGDGCGGDPDDTEEDDSDCCKAGDDRGMHISLTAR